jgi:hypothetical protein
VPLSWNAVSAATRASACRDDGGEHGRRGEKKRESTDGAAQHDLPCRLEVTVA